MQHPIELHQEAVLRGTLLVQQAGSCQYAFCHGCDVAKDGHAVLYAILMRAPRARAGPLQSTLRSPGGSQGDLPTNQQGSLDPEQITALARRLSAQSRLQEIGPVPPWAPLDSWPTVHPFLPGSSASHHVDRSLTTTGTWWVPESGPS
jgi:hypothetical protein